MRETELQIRNYLARPGRYVNIDGSNELTWGAMLWGMALLDRISSAVPRWVHLAYVPAMVLAVHGAGKLLKHYVTYPRTGYVAYPDAARIWRPRAVAVVLGIATALAAAQFLRGGSRLIGMLAVVNVLFYAVAAQPVRGWKWGVVPAMAAASLWLREGQELWFFGAAFLASGLATLTLYLRRTRRIPGL